MKTEKMDIGFELKSIGENQIDGRFVLTLGGVVVFSQDVYLRPGDTVTMTGMTAQMNMTIDAA
jgi:hypothetical protein